MPSYCTREATTDEIDGFTLNTSSVGDLFRHLSGSIGTKQNILEVNLTAKIEVALKETEHFHAITNAGNN
jgi:hypothetical protein